MLLKVVQHSARIVGNDSSPLHRPPHVNNLASIRTQVLLQDGARWFGVCTDVAVKSAKGGRLMVDLSLHIGICSPGSNGQQACTNCIQDRDAPM